jgi:murein DD-endopeptidase MepM/ murein hydrolase activator NlpD
MTFKSKLITLSAVLFSFTFYSQNESFYIIDTIEIRGKTAILFQDNSWQYLELIDPNEQYNTINDFKQNVLDTNYLFTNDWNNDRCYNRNIKLANLKDTLEINTHGKMVAPTTGRISSPFGKRWGKIHKGIDIANKEGTSVKTIQSGKVRYAKFNKGGYGNLVIIRHYNGTETYYAHLSKINVKENQLIEIGEEIGKMGNTGTSTGSHLHFELRYMHNAFNCEKYFDIINGDWLVKEKMYLTSNDFWYQRKEYKHLIDSEEIVTPNKVVNTVPKKREDGRRVKNTKAYYGDL